MVISLDFPLCKRFKSPGKLAFCQVSLTWRMMLPSMMTAPLGTYARRRWSARCLEGENAWDKVGLGWKWMKIGWDERSWLWDCQRVDASLSWWYRILVTIKLNRFNWDCQVLNHGMCARHCANAGIAIRRIRLDDCRFGAANFPRNHSNQFWSVFPRSRLGIMNSITNPSLEK